jgi:predicted transcriptional regulator
MPKKPTSKVRTGRSLLVATRLPHDLVARLDALAEKLALPGLPVTRAEATRAAITAGIEVVERGARSRGR